MLDQSFTVDNFRKIFDYENRKGCYLEGLYFPEIEIITKKLKACANDFKKLKKEKTTLSLDAYENKKSKLNQHKEYLENQKKILLTQELEKISTTVHEDDFNVKLVQANTPINKKPVYSIDKSDSCSYFLIKQIQYNIRKLYKVKQSSRYNIICQLRSLLNNNFSKYIIRTDIKDFYEKISRKNLFDKINKDGLLTLSSRKFIKQILNEYEKISRSDIGIPRGIGISAYLAELYMRDFDEAIKKHPEIIFYARYVDDIIAIYAPKPNSDYSMILDEIREEAKKINLDIHEDNSHKTKKIDLTFNKNASFEYLGYCFEIKNKSVDIEISKSKIKRYKNRIKLVFDAYLEINSNKKVARKILVKRLRFLTGNTRLSNKDALVGIYFSNSLITNSSSLMCLDSCLEQQILHLIRLNRINPNLEVRLKKLKFVDGWTQKRFYKFSPKELQEIVKVWKNVA